MHRDTTWAINRPEARPVLTEPNAKLLRSSHPTRASTRHAGDCKGDSVCRCGFDAQSANILIYYLNLAICCERLQIWIE